MAKFCPNCGSEVKEGKFCSNCGTTMDNEQNSTTVANTTSNNQNNSNGMAVAGFTISLVSFLLCCGCFNWLSLIFSIVGLVQSKEKNGNGKGLAIAGIIISSITIIVFILLVFTGMLAGIAEEIPSSFYDI